MRLLVLMCAVVFIGVAVSQDGKQQQPMSELKASGRYRNLDLSLLGIWLQCDGQNWTADLKK